MSDDLNYVYTHTDPRTNKIVYVGAGTGARSAETKSSRRGGGSSGRHKANATQLLHELWGDELARRGFSYFDFVTHVRTRMTKEESRKLEREILDGLSYRPIFNAPTGADPKIAERVPELLAMGLKQSDIARIINQ